MTISSPLSRTAAAHRRIAAIVLLTLLLVDARAANFVDARYDPHTDELVVTLAYRGTNPNHTFTIEWGECRSTGDGGYEVAGRVLDDQWDDRAQQPFRTIARFPVHALRCRPATVFLHTAPNFRIAVPVPALGSSERQSRGPDAGMR